MSTEDAHSDHDDRPAMELGLYTFAELTPDPARGATVNPAQRLRDLLEEIELADQVGLDVFGVGEHHRPDFAVSAPAVVLAAAADAHRRASGSPARSRVLSSDDPVRVFQDFATLDLLSGGRAEIMAGRGSFIESFPLFGYDLDDYDELFAEKLELLLTLRESERVTWSGRTARRSTTAASTRARCRTRCRSGSRSAARRSRWCARARSACRWRWRSSAATPERFAPLAELLPRRGAPRPGTTRAAAGEHQLARLRRRHLAGRPPTTPSRPTPTMMNRIGRERGWPPMTRARLRRRAGRRAARTSSAARRR